MTDYFRPIACTGAKRPPGAVPLAGGLAWFTHAEHSSRGGANEIVPAGDIDRDTLDALCRPRRDFCGLGMDRPRLMGILNVTPDSFSDGGRFDTPDAAVAQAHELAHRGADILDIGGESTRPGSDPVDEAEEIARTAPVIAEIGAGCDVPVSIDTRKSAVAQAAFRAGATMLNDVSALAHDPALARLAAAAGVPLCLMHAQGEPKSMQDDPRYDDVLLDVFDFLAERVAFAESSGVARDRIAIDPGIGFGKTLEHNLTLLRNISLFHGLGCPIVLGASRKRFIGTIAGEPDPVDRMPGSVAVALAAIAQGVQIVRVHDIRATRQALSLHLAIGA